jgi:aminopeptidase-like protein
MKIGKEMYQWAIDLFPLNRSITGSGVRETFAYLRSILPSIVVKEVPSGTPVFDWIVPDEWVLRDAWIKDELGNEVINFKNNNLHIVGYSEPVDKWLSLDELNQYLYSIPEQP